ncbi:MAG: hypothetical protein H8D23_11070 [Candidatus Brocadiales bacterium]|nr:hypothetical protein [Candidatus Brocadiales bacterium]
MKVIKHWVEFFHTGIFTADYSRKDLNGATHPLNIQFPDNAYAFKMYSREDVVEGNKTYKGEKRQQGKLYYHPDSRITTLDQVKNDLPSDQVGPALISNMECNDWESVIWTRWMSWPQPYDYDKMEIL